MVVFSFDMGLYFTWRGKTFAFLASQTKLDGRCACKNRQQLNCMVCERISTQPPFRILKLTIVVQACI
jgi:hypothetical protein